MSEHIQKQEYCAELVEIEAAECLERLKHSDLRIIDVREPDEFSFEKIAGAISMPLSIFDPAALNVDEAETVILYCQSGNRSGQAATKLQAAGWPKVTHLAGGIRAWKVAGFSTEKGGRVLPIMRQVQIAAGSLVLLGLGLGWLVHPAFIGLSAFVGCGLVFAGLSGWCGMALFLGRMPWNRSSSATGASCSL